MSLLCNWFSPHLHTCRNTRGSTASDYLIIAWLQFYFANLLNVYTDLRLWGPLSLGQSDAGRQRDELHDRWDDDGITEITRNKVISGPGRSRLMMLCSLLPRLRWKLPRRQESGMRRVTKSRSSHDTRYFCVQRDQWRVTSCAGLPPIVTIKSRGTFQSRLLSAADISDFLRNNICSSISFPLNYSYIIWLDDHKKSTVSTVNCTNIKSILCLHTETTYMAVFICLKNIIHRFSPLHDQ